jgi:two-component system NtrC family response regulator
MNQNGDQRLPRLLIVEDDDEMREQMRWAFAGDYEVFEAADRDSAIAEQRRVRAPLVTLDLGLPPNTDGYEEGFSTLEALLRFDDLTKVIVITGKSEKDAALGAIERGAHHFLNKPVNIDELGIILRHALAKHGLDRTLREVHPTADGAFEGMLGTSEGMRRIFRTVEQVAASSAPVLVLGESGTGKELIARAIHRRSDRSSGPFVAINCAVFSEGVLESELFGHEKGAFTGAQTQRPGHFELADGGTLFLDELGEMPLATQVKLLRFLQEFVVVRVGGRQEIKIDARVIAATNANLKALIAKGGFREDLYYRLAIVSIEVPALRERRNDILPMAQAFLVRDLQAEGKAPRTFSASAREALERFTWPGNVRQLENHVRRAALMSCGSQVTVEDLKLPTSGQFPAVASQTTTLRAARDIAERELIRSTLERHGGNISRSARELGVSRPTLHSLIQKHGLKD